MGSDLGFRTTIGEPDYEFPNPTLDFEHAHVSSPLPAPNVGCRLGQQTLAGALGNGSDAPLAAILVRAIDLASISAEEFVEKRIDFVILVLDRDPMRRSRELFEPISHASGF